MIQIDELERWVVHRPKNGQSTPTRALTCSSVVFKPHEKQSLNKGKKTCDGAEEKRFRGEEREGLAGKLIILLLVASSAIVNMGGWLLLATLAEVKTLPPADVRNTTN